MGCTGGCGHYKTGIQVSQLFKVKPMDDSNFVANCVTTLE